MGVASFEQSGTIIPLGDVSFRNNKWWRHQAGSCQLVCKAPEVSKRKQVGEESGLFLNS